MSYPTRSTPTSTPPASPKTSPFDLVLAAGDLPGAYLEYVATKVRVPVLFVPGNHGEEWVLEEGRRKRPGGVVNLHGRLFRHQGRLFYGIGGCPAIGRGRASFPRGSSSASP